MGLVGVDGGETTSNVEVVRLARVAREGNEGDGVAVQEEESAMPTTMWTRGAAPAAAGAAEAGAEAGAAAGAEAGAEAGAAAEAAARGHDSLLAHLSAESELGRLVRDNLTSEGYVVLRGVLSRDECDAQP